MLRLAYDIFLQKEDGWKISMKYFQNVVDIVRDLMSPNGEEQHYKNGIECVHLCVYSLIVNTFSE